VRGSGRNFILCYFVSVFVGGLRKPAENLKSA